MKTGPKPVPIEARFWAAVFPEPMSGCWLWDGGYGSSGYGRLSTGSRTARDRRKIPAHRYSYELHKGAIPKKLDVCHRCDNTSCVNPDHLFIGTRKDNMQDCKAKGRIYRPPRKATCIAGHEQGDKNVRIARDGRRVCKKCQANHQSSYRQRKKIQHKLEAGLE